MKVITLFSFRLKDEYFLIYENIAFQAIHILRQVKSYCLKIDIWGSFFEFSSVFQSENLLVNPDARTDEPKIAKISFLSFLRSYHTDFHNILKWLLRALEVLNESFDLFNRFNRPNLP